MLLTLVISLLLVLYAGWIVSRKDRTMLNWLTPAIAVGVPAHFLFPYLYTLYFQTGASLFSQIYCSACYVAMILMPALAYRWLKMPAIGWRGPKPSVRWAHWAVLGLSVIVFSPILIEFRSQLSDPRAIYEATRSGYGLTFFGSAMLLDAAVVLFFFRRSKNIFADSLFWIIVALSTVEHGSKGELITFFWIWMLYRVYVERRSFRIIEVGRIAILFAVALVSSFVLFGNAEIADLVEGLAKYADYTRNAALVIDDPQRPVYYGLVAVEDEVYARVPRAIFPGKPDIFGALRVIHNYYPDAWARGWAPDFGVGFAYADFGPLAIFYIAVCAMINGIGCSMLIRKLRTDPNPGNLVILIFFSGVTFIPTGMGTMLPEHVLLSGCVLGVTRIPRIRIFPRRLPSVLPQA
jgi:hypothetical protein